MQNLSLQVFLHIEHQQALLCTFMCSTNSVIGRQQNSTSAARFVSNMNDRADLNPLNASLCGLRYREGEESIQHQAMEEMQRVHT